MENFKKSNELLEAIANGVAFDKETGLIWEHWLNSVTEQVEKNNLELCGGECSNENSGLNIPCVSKRSELLIAFMNYMRYEYGTGAIPQHNHVVERFLKSNL